MTNSTMDAAPDSSNILVSVPRWHMLRTDLRWAYRGMTEPQNCDRWLQVPHLSAWLILSGSASVQTAEMVCKARQGEWLIAPRGKRLQKTSRNCEILSICFVWQWVDGRELLHLENGLTIREEEAPVLKGLGLRLAEMSRTETNDHRLEGDRPIPSHLTLQGCFCEWLAEFYREVTKRGVAVCVAHLDSRVEEAIQIIASPKAHFPRPSELARRVGLSPSQLNRLFLRELKLTVANYCDRRKLEAAHTLLGTSALSVKETAFQLGFVSQQHFARWFRKNTGLSPSDAIKNRRGMI